MQDQHHIISYDNFTKQQLISHLIQLEENFQDFSSQSSQVEELLQQQLETYLNQLTEKDQIIRHMTEKLSNLDTLKIKVTNLETENDLLESTIRTLTVKLNSEVEMHNECIEKISFLENELEWFKSSSQQDNETILLNQKDQNYKNSKFKHYSSKDWKQQENIWIDKINSLQTQLDELKNSKSDLEEQISKLLHLINHDQHLYNKKNFQILLKTQKDLTSSLKKSESEKKLLKKNLILLQRKYAKVHFISNMVKLKKRGLVTAYKTPALDPLA
ncbi:hypothetical protein C6P40_001848 [Pichia californica]|uniref:Uncharacterized protein n=1 Tax=Pichia californica TaxID=460514 RepID=A0A9P6WIZ2_9ASCO|nr:hypothetical protein C6P42_001348 [[Candida] californica]KAG0687806.1 hypothetical protein C6P40_001848 [[Candida] californica]